MKDVKAERYLANIGRHQPIKVSESSKLQSEVEVERPLPALTREPLHLLKMEEMLEIDNFSRFRLSRNMNLL